MQRLDRAAPTYLRRLIATLRAAAPAGCPYYTCSDVNGAGVRDIVHRFVDEQPVAIPPRLIIIAGVTTTAATIPTATRTREPSAVQRGDGKVCNNSPGVVADPIVSGRGVAHRTGGLSAQAPVVSAPTFWW